MGLSQFNLEQLRQVEALANKFARISSELKATVEKCVANQSLEGIDEMVAYSFNSQQHTPKYGGAGSLPPGKFKGVIINSGTQNVEKNGMTVGGYLQFEIAVVDGPLQGQTMVDRLNVNNSSAQAVQIANNQLAAYCAVIGKPMFQDTSELHNIPFMFEVGWQKGNEPSEAKPEGGYTEIKRLFDMNGNEPGKAGNGPQQGNSQGGFGQQQQQPTPPNNPAGGVTAQGGWPNQQGGGQQQPQQGFQQPQQGGFDPNANQQPQPPQGGAGAGWPGNNGAQQQQPQQGGGAPQGWQQNGNAQQGGGGPGWGR